MISKTLVVPTDAHITALMQWFPDAASVAIWSPSNDFPFVERERFIVQTKLRELPTYMMVDEAGTPLAFGQYYERLGCCHLGRLVVAPEQRGKGLGAVLIRELIARGTVSLGIGRCSLFVLEYNVPARNLYRKLGFVEALYPEPLPLPGCLYLRREAVPGSPP